MDKGATDVAKQEDIFETEKVGSFRQVLPSIEHDRVRGVSGCDAFFWADNGNGLKVIVVHVLLWPFGQYVSLVAMRHH